MDPIDTPLRNFDEPTMDPASGGNAGFSGQFTDYVIYGVYNGNFSRGPQDPTQNITPYDPTDPDFNNGSNFMPNWRFIQSSNTNITASQVRDVNSPSGSNFRCTIVAGAANDAAFVEQIVDIGGARSRWFGYFGYASFLNVASTSNLFQVFLEATYLSVDGLPLVVAQGSVAITVGSVLSGLQVPAPPGQARFLRLRLGVQRDSAPTSATATVDFTDVHMDRAYVRLIAADTVSPVWGPGQIFQQNAVMTLIPGDAGAGGAGRVTIDGDTGNIFLEGGHVGTITAFNDGGGVELTNGVLAKAFLTAKGNLIGASASASPALITVGANGTILTADSTQAAGVKWATPAAPSGTAGGVLSGTYPNPGFAASPTFTGTVTIPTPPSNPTDAASKGYVDGVASGLAVKASAKLATAAALPTNTYLAGAITITATGTLTVDGVVTALGDRILVKNEVTQANNGLYSVTTAGAVGVAAVLTRTTDMNTGAEVPGAFAFVEVGTANAGAGFVVAGAGPYTIGTTAIVWTQFSGAGEITVDSSLGKTGNQLQRAALTGVVTASAGSNATAFGSSTGSGAVVLATSPTLVTPALGTPSSGVGTNLTGTAAGLTAGAVTGTPTAFTPTLAFATPGTSSWTYSVQSGTYVQLGNCVMFSLRVRATVAVGTASGNFVVGGLPVTVSSSADAPGNASCVMTGYTKANFTEIMFVCQSGTTTALINASGSGQTIANLALADINTGGTIEVRAGGSYYV